MEIFFKAMLSTLLVNAFNSPICLLAPIAIERFGRRPMFILLSTLSTLELAFFLIAQTFVDLNQPGWIPTIFALIGCAMGQAAFNIGILNMAPILIGELCPYASRSLVTQVSQVIQNSLMLFLVIDYPSATKMMGAAFFLPLLIASIFLLVLLIRFLPETQGRPVDEIFRSLTLGSSDSDALLDEQLSQDNNTYGSLQYVDEIKCSDVNVKFC